MERNISLFGLRSLSRVEIKSECIVSWIGEVDEKRKNHETFCCYGDEFWHR